MRYEGILALSFVILLPAIGQAAVALGVSAQGTGGPFQEDAGGVISAGFVTGRATAFTGGTGNAVVQQTGPALQCRQTSKLSVEAMGCATVETNSVALHAYSGAFAPNGRATGGALMTDVVQFPDSTASFNFHLDFTRVLTGSGFQTLSFSVLAVSEDTLPGSLFSFGYDSRGLGASPDEPWLDPAAIWRIGNPDGSIEEGYSLASAYSLDRAFSFTRSSGGPWSANLVLLLSVESGCYTEDCESTINAENTAFLGITSPYVSGSGYTYPGVAATAVPEPGTTVIVLAGLGACLLRRRQ